MKKEAFDKLANKTERLSKLLNGGKGSGNFGHAGRPGKRGGSNTSSSTTARLARGDKAAEARAKVDEMSKELRERPFSSMSEKEYREAESKIAEARRKADELEEENKRLTREETQRGITKKRQQDTPGKKQTLEAIDEAKKINDEAAELFHQRASATPDSAEYERLDKEYKDVAKKYEASLAKVGTAVSSQMIQDQAFQNDLKQHIEDGLGIKVDNLKLKTTKMSYGGRDLMVVGGSVKIAPADLGGFGKLMRGAEVRVSTVMDSNINRNRFGAMLGSVDLNYTLRSGGENSINAFKMEYSPDGTYYIRDSRNES